MKVERSWNNQKGIKELKLNKLTKSSLLDIFFNNMNKNNLFHDSKPTPTAIRNKISKQQFADIQEANGVFTQTNIAVTTTCRA